MILKVSHNVRLNSDMNMSFAIESVVDTESEAEAMGLESAAIMKAYMNGFNAGFVAEEEDEDE